MIFNMKQLFNYNIYILELICDISWDELFTATCGTGHHACNCNCSSTSLPVNTLLFVWCLRCHLIALNGEIWNMRCITHQVWKSLAIHASMCWSLPWCISCTDTAPVHPSFPPLTRRCLLTDDILQVKRKACLSHYYELRKKQCRQCENHLV